MDFLFFAYMYGGGAYMKCPRCLNTDPSWFYKGSRGWYCRRCISFHRVMIEETMEPVSLQDVKMEAGEYSMQYPLTKQQEQLSEKIIENIETGDILCHCVCGAGKTELVVGVISHYLRHGKKVCFAIARRQVVLEVAQRLQKYFTYEKVIAVCGGHTQVIDGDLIVCTTHQLYRYYQAFDLLILDEPDAFPFHGDPVLHGLAQSACVGRTVYLTATPDETLRKRVEEGTLLSLQLHVRPHGKPIPVPVIHTGPLWLLLVHLFVWLRSHRNHPRIVFVPSRSMCHQLSALISLTQKCFHVTSQDENRDEIIDMYRRSKNGVIVATTVLERGVTIPDVDVCVFGADSPSFNEAALIQMAGRAGRSFSNPYGDVLFLCMERSDLCHRCRKQIIEDNSYLMQEGRDL